MNKQIIVFQKKNDLTRFTENKQINKNINKDKEIFI